MKQKPRRRYTAEFKSQDIELLKAGRPVPTRMRYPIEAAVRHFRKWIRNGCRAIGKRTLPLEYIEAGTVGAARK